jgi:hypothetical protein
VFWQSREAFDFGPFNITFRVQNVDMKHEYREGPKAAARFEKVAAQGLPRIQV